MKSKMLKGILLCKCYKFYPNKVKMGSLELFGPEGGKMSLDWQMRNSWQTSVASSYFRLLRTLAL